jgi:hypothetical protein
MAGMASSGVGVDATALAERSLMRLERFNVVKPRAVNDALLVASVDPNGIAVGGSFTLAYTGKLRQARQVTMTINDDDAGGGLSVTAIVTGHRFGVQVVEELTATSANTNDLVDTSVHFFDEVTSIKLKAKTADAGDDVTFGISDAGFGLPHPIDKVADVLMIAWVDAGTDKQIAVDATSVNVAESAIIGLTIVAADDFEVEYLRSRFNDGFGTKGVF